MRCSLTSFLPYPHERVAARHWDTLPADTVAGIGSLLSPPELVRLSTVDRRTRHALLRQLDAARLQWLLERVSNHSTLDAALAGIERQPLRPAIRAEMLWVLFERIQFLPFDMGDTACSKLLDAAASLPVSARGALLRRIVEMAAPWPAGWSDRALSRDPQMVSPRVRHERALWAMIDKQPRPERSVLLVLAVDAMERADFASVNLDDWIERALALPDGHLPMRDDAGQSITCRGKLLAALVRGAQKGGVLRDGARFRRFVAVFDRLHAADGRPAVQERAALLVELVSALLRCHELERDDIARIWDDLLEATCRLPPDAATPVMLRLADWFASPRQSGDAARAQRLWVAARQPYGGDIAVRAQWIVALQGYVPDRARLWHTLWSEWRASIRPEGHRAAMLLGRAAAGLPPLHDGMPAWSVVLAEIPALPVEHRGALLAGLAQGLRDGEADPSDIRWNAVVDAATSLSAAAQWQVLGECIDHDVVLLRRYWDRYLALLAALPPGKLGRVLPVALYLTRELDHDDAERAWWTVAAQLCRAPAQAQAEPWRALFRVVQSLYDDDEQQLSRAHRFLEAPLRSQPPAVQRDLLLDAIDDLEACEYEAHFRWLLSQAEALPSALRAPVLGQLALQGLAIELAAELMPIWDALAAATARLPLQYRGGPLHGLERLYGSLPAEHEQTALPALLSLCDGVPPADIPPALASFARLPSPRAIYQR